jgi:hypothetical protein
MLSMHNPFGRQTLFLRLLKAGPPCLQRGRPEGQNLQRTVALHFVADIFAGPSAYAFYRCSFVCLLTISQGLLSHPPPPTKCSPL